VSQDAYTIIDDYFDRINEPKPVEERKSDFDHLMIERRNHVCIDFDFIENFRLLFKGSNAEFYESEYLQFSITDEEEARLNLNNFI